MTDATLAGLELSAAPTRSRPRIARSPGGVAGVACATLLLLFSLAPVLGLLPHDALTQSPADALQSPSAQHWFGTDQFGRDIFARTADATRLSFQVAILAIAIAAIVGTAAGVVAGYLRGWIDVAVVGLADVLFAFPAILLALVVVTALGPGWFNTAVAIGIVYAPIFMRVARGPILALREREFMLAGRVLGYSTARLLTRHALPNVFPVIVVQVTLSLAWAILTESSLSFLGLGAQPPQASLGSMVAEGTPFGSVAWWMLVFPALAITLAVLAVNLLGDALRDAVDPMSIEAR